MDMNYRGGMWEGGGGQDGVEWRGRNGTTVIAYSINISKKINKPLEKNFLNFFMKVNRWDFTGGLFYTANYLLDIISKCILPTTVE